jgi:hypothetical protein
MILRGVGLVARMLFLCRPKCLIGQGMGVMPVVLLLLGIVTTIAGLVLVASGVTIRDGTFDAETVTPGTIASIGGLLLIGMALAVRELQRIERALAIRPMPRTTRPADVAAADAAAGVPEAPVRIPFPSRPKSDPQAASAATNSATGEDAALERLRVKFPTLVGREDGPVVEEDAAEVKHAAGAGGNGAAPARPLPRMDVRARPAAAPDKAKASGLGAFLSAGARRDNRAAPAQAVAAVVAAPPAGEAQPESAPAVSSTAHVVSVLKSGVVEGMAYTLYSDGSIEAQLPQGTLRFGSITALREHIDNTA